MLVEQAYYLQGGNCSGLRYLILTSTYLCGQEALRRGITLSTQYTQFKLYCDPHHVSAWVGWAIRCNVEELCLDVHLNTATRLPCEIFTCASLRVLKLRGNIRPRFPPSVMLPLLKILDLDLTKLEIRDGDVSFPTFLSGCLLLEELYIYGELKFSILISVPTLKKLKLHFVKSSANSVILKINTPFLQELDLTDRFFRNYEIVNIGNVARVALCVYKDRYSASLFNLFNGLSNVQSLTLSCETIRFLNDGGVDNLSLPQFHNLAYLWIGLSQNCSWDMLVSLLQNAENLEVLVIENFFKRNRRMLTSVLSTLVKTFKCKTKRDELGHSWTGPGNIPSCVLTSLKVFEFSGIQRVRADLDFMQYIIQSSSALEKVKFITAKSKSLIERMSQIQRASSPAIRWDIQYEDDSPDVLLEG